MDLHRGSHHRLINKRQGVGGIFGGLASNGSTSGPAEQGTTTSAGSQNTGVGIIGEFTSLIGDITTLFIPSSTGSTTTATSSAHTTTSTSSATSTSTSMTSTTPTPASTTSVSEMVYTTSDGTSVVYVTSTLPAPTTTPARSTSFLQNPSLESGVFTLVGIVVLFIVCFVVTWTIRKRRRDRLENDLAAAVTFDPGATDYYEREENSVEKRRLSGSSSSHAHGYGYSVQPAYAPQQEYHGPMTYAQYPVVAYHAPPNSELYRVPSTTVSQPVIQGGANLTRKFSNRKPVPPLLPDPAYAPSNSHVSIPPQFYHQ